MTKNNSNCTILCSIVTTILYLSISVVNAQKLPSINPSNSDIMELARNRYFNDLPFPKDYKPGKYSAYGFPEPGKKSTVFELDGPGVITRIWTTNSSAQDIMRLFVYVDDNNDPVLYGTARAIAAAAQKLSIQAVPWGGFLDGYSVSLYLPIPFKRHIRIDAEYYEKTDGPYWQIDYKLGIDPGKFAWKQIITPNGLQIVPTGNIEEMHKTLQTNQQFIKEINVSFEPVDILLDGPAVIRCISMKSSYLDKIQMRMVFDGDTGFVDLNRRIDHVNFQVDVPLKYFISNFNTAGIQRIGNEAIIYFPMPFKKKAMLQLLTTAEEIEFGSQFPLTINIEYEKNSTDIDRMYYFHAAASTEISNGYKDFEVLKVRGEGHFVGVTLFNTGHDHGGGDNIFFDAGTSYAGQLHGICAEDYFHHAYMRIGINAPYIDCPTHSARCRHHIEMPIPFHQSFTFNWGCFAGVIPTAIAIWYQKDTKEVSSDELTYEITGPFRLSNFEELAPGKELPANASVLLDLIFEKVREFPRQTWQVKAQNGFLDLCHTFRRYTNTIPPCSGIIDTKSCIVAKTNVWVVNDTETEFIIGCDDRIRVFLGNQLIGESNLNNKNFPFKQFSIKASLKTGINTITVVAANTINSNWSWNGFSLVLKNNLNKNQIHYAY